MTELGIGVLGFGALFALMILRTPVAFAMLLAGFFGMWVLEGFRTAGALILTESYGAVASETLIVVPMFVLLGNIASAAGFSAVSAFFAAGFLAAGFFAGLAETSSLSASIAA